MINWITKQVAKIMRDYRANKVRRACVDIVKAWGKEEVTPGYVNPDGIPMPQSFQEVYRNSSLVITSHRYNIGIEIVSNNDPRTVFWCGTFDYTRLNAGTWVDEVLALGVAAKRYLANEDDSLFAPLNDGSE